MKGDSSQNLSMSDPWAYPAHISVIIPSVEIRTKAG